ncbi:hypothetical protein BKA57DRAFT_32896 [Linnemannia elongata]|nr:hypothetical protein BKA57DRAFT_32896 [Linnemannia elongata]
MMRVEVKKKRKKQEREGRLRVASERNQEGAWKKKGGLLVVVVVVVKVVGDKEDMDMVVAFCRQGRERERESRWKWKRNKNKKEEGRRMSKSSGGYARSFKVFAAPEPGLGFSFSPVPWPSFFLFFSFWIYLVRCLSLSRTKDHLRGRRPKQLKRIISIITREKAFPMSLFLHPLGRRKLSFTVSLSPFFRSTTLHACRQRCLMGQFIPRADRRAWANSSPSIAGERERVSENSTRKSRRWESTN